MPFTVIDNSLTLIEQICHQGLIAVFGDTIKPHILELADLKTARQLIITSLNGYKSGEITQKAKEVRPDIIIYARACFDDEVEYIEEYGATKVITGVQEIANHIIELVNSDTDISTTSNNKIVLTQILFNNTSLANQITENKEKTNIEINVNLSASHGSAIE